MLTRRADGHVPQSIVLPRPTTLSLGRRFERSRTNDWSPHDRAGPRSSLRPGRPPRRRSSLRPSIRSGVGGSPLAAAEPARSRGGLPSTAWSPTRTALRRRTVPGWMTACEPNLGPGARSWTSWWMTACGPTIAAPAPTVLRASTTANGRDPGRRRRGRARRPRSSRRHWPWLRASTARRFGWIVGRMLSRRAIPGSVVGDGPDPRAAARERAGPGFREARASGFGAAAVSPAQRPAGAAGRVGAVHLGLPVVAERRRPAPTPRPRRDGPGRPLAGRDRRPRDDGAATHARLAPDPPD